MSSIQLLTVGSSQRSRFQRSKEKRKLQKIVLTIEPHILRSVFFNTVYSIQGIRSQVEKYLLQPEAVYLIYLQKVMYEQAKRHPLLLTSITFRRSINLRSVNNVLMNAPVRPTRMKLTCDNPSIGSLKYFSQMTCLVELDLWDVSKDRWIDDTSSYYFLPSSLRTLVLPQNSQGPFLKACFPESLTSLVFGYYYASRLDEFVLPRKLLHLSMPARYNHPIPKNLLPSTLTSLTLYARMSYTQQISLDAFPPKLTSLEIVTVETYEPFYIFDPTRPFDYLHQINELVSGMLSFFPNTLTSLSIPYLTPNMILPRKLVTLQTLFHRPDCNNLFPPSLTHLRIKDHHQAELIIPEGITTIEYSRPVILPLPGKDLPVSLQQIIIPSIILPSTMINGSGSPRKREPMSLLSDDAHLIHLSSLVIHKHQQQSEGIYICFHIPKTVQSVSIAKRIMTNDMDSRNEHMSVHACLRMASVYLSMTSFTCISSDKMRQAHFLLNKLPIEIIGMKLSPQLMLQGENVFLIQYPACYRDEFFASIILTIHLHLTVCMSDFPVHNLNVSIHDLNQ